MYADDGGDSFLQYSQSTMQCLVMGKMKVLCFDNPLTVFSAFGWMQLLNDITAVPAD